MWYVYILECSDKTYYTGVTVDPKRRLREHNSSSSGARYTKARRPVKLVFKQKEKDKRRAYREEWRIKKLTRPQKEALIAG
jgi:putative endonuclease